MTSRRSITIAAALVGAAAVGAGGGAAVYAGLGGHDGTRTVVRQVTVTGAQQAANTSALSVGEIYLYDIAPDGSMRSKEIRAANVNTGRQ